MTSSPDKNMHYEQLMPVIMEQLANGHAVRIYPRGTSMLPMIRQGIDSVELSPVTGKLKKYDLPFYKRENGQYILHRILKVGETYTCIGDNQTVYEEGVRQEQLLAVATAYYRKDKRHEMNTLGHKCYCRFWQATRWMRRIWRKAKWKLKKTGE